MDRTRRKLSCYQSFQGEPVISTVIYFSYVIVKYKAIKTFLLLVLTCLICSCAVDDYKNFDRNTALKENSVPIDWKGVEASDVKFYLPVDLTEKEPRHLMMKGSTAKFYGNENIWLVFTIQSSSIGSDRFIKERDFNKEKIVIDGKQAEISTFTGTNMVNEAEGRNYVASLDVPQVQGNTKNLLMWAYSKSPEDRETVIKIFRSVQFLQEQ